MKNKILLIDDDKQVLKSLENLLKKEGYNVTAIDDGFKAISVAEREIFDLVIVDIRMPNINGLEVIRRIKAHQDRTDSSRSEFMVITGFADDDAPKEGAQLGITEFMVKPFDKELFLNAVKNFLSKKHEPLSFPKELREGKIKSVSFQDGCFIYEKTVLLKDTNLMGNTYFANYILWQGEAREACFLSHPRYQEEANKIKHIKMITHSLYHRFIQESTFGDVIQIKITSREIKSCSFVIVFRYYNKLSGTFLGEGWQRVAFIDQEKGTFAPIPRIIQELAYSVCEDLKKEEKR